MSLSDLMQCAPCALTAQGRPIRLVTSRNIGTPMEHSTGLQLVALLLASAEWPMHIVDI